MKIISRAEAKLKNLTRYYTGKPCKRNHLSERKVANSNCVDCDSIYSAKHYIKHRERVKAKSTSYYSKNSDKVKKYQRQYAINNKDMINARHHHRYNNDPKYKMKFRLRGMLTKVLNRLDTNKESKAHDILGYSCADLKEHLESLFVDGMCWDNHGEWHIDHIIPIKVLTEYGVTDPAFINGLDNLQPLWAIDNLRKGDWSNL